MLKGMTFFRGGVVADEVRDGFDSLHGVLVTVGPLAAALFNTSSKTHALSRVAFIALHRAPAFAFGVVVVARKVPTLQVRRATTRRRTYRVVFRVFRVYRDDVSEMELRRVGLVAIEVTNEVHFLRAADIRRAGAGVRRVRPDDFWAGADSRS